MTEKTTGAVVAMPTRRAQMPQVFASSEPLIHNIDQMERLAGTLAKSGYFSDVRDAAQALVKMLAGHSLGIGPIQSLVDIHIVDGKPSYAAGLLLGLVQRSQVFRYRIREWTAQKCAIEFYENTGAGWESLGVASFTMQDAARAGLVQKRNWKQYPDAMLLSRAATKGVRAFCPAVTGGPVYTPDELGDETYVEVADEAPGSGGQGTAEPEPPIDVTPPAVSEEAPEPEPEEDPRAMGPIQPDDPSPEEVAAGEAGGDDDFDAPGEEEALPADEDQPPSAEDITELKRKFKDAGIARLAMARPFIQSQIELGDRDPKEFRLEDLTIGEVAKVLAALDAKIRSARSGS